MAAMAASSDPSEDDLDQLPYLLEDAFSTKMMSSVVLSD
jgi:hypothetical protein